MRLSTAILSWAVLSDATVSAIAVPASDVIAYQPLAHAERDSDSYQDLWKRRGGGGSGGRGGSGSSSGGSSSGSGSSSGGSSSGGSSSSGGATGSGRGSTGSSSGGTTKTGSGTTPAYGGGSYYSGGARSPYRAGGISPLGGIAPFLLVGGALAFWPGLWYHPAYYYPYTHPYGYYNHSSGKNESKPVSCACDQTVECGCDDDGNNTSVSELVGDGSYANLNRSLINVADVNGTSTILLNGTLPNGTTASGGDEDAFSAGVGLHALLEFAGWWPVVATAVATAFLT